MIFFSYLEIGESWSNWIGSTIVVGQFDLLSDLESLLLFGNLLIVSKREDVVLLVSLFKIWHNRCNNQNGIYLIQQDALILFDYCNGFANNLPV